jgi:hypothetical protein
MQRLSALFSKHRRRLAPLVLLAFALIVSRQLLPSWPRETDVSFALGQDHADVVELRVAYLRGDEELHGVSFSFPEGAPGVVHHKVTLPAGEFELRCELRQRSGGSRTLIRRLHEPARAVRIELARDSLSCNERVTRPSRPAGKAVGAPLSRGSLRASRSAPVLGWTSMRSVRSVRSRAA